MNKNIVFKMIFCSLVYTIFLAGCGSSKYACKGYPDGVTCADPATVYKLTEERDRVSGLNLEDPKVREALEGEAGEMGKKSNKKEVIEGVLRPPVDMTKPILEPAQVLRIWIAPWIDEAQDLHGASYVFTEVTPRRWSFGSYGQMEPAGAYPFQLQAPATNTSGKGMSNRPQQGGDSVGQAIDRSRSGGNGSKTMASPPRFDFEQRREEK